MRFVFKICILVAIISFGVSRKIDFHFRSIMDGTQEAVTCQVGDQIEVHLAENPSTGYEWIIPEERENFNSVWSLSESTFEKGGGSNQERDGAAGIHRFTFSCDYSGTEHLTLVYGRPDYYQKAIDEFRKVGLFDALTMHGKALQLRITAIR